MLEGMSKTDECGTEKFGTLDSSDKTIAILGDSGHRRRNSKGIRRAKSFYLTFGKNVMSAQMLEVSLLGVGTVLRLERNAYSMAK